MGYIQLTLAERYQIAILYRWGFTQRYIASEVGRHLSTVSRELKRNQGPDGYCADLAQRLALKRRRSKGRARLDSQLWLAVDTLLKLDWSPEQISLWLAQHWELRISHEWIYQHVLRDKRRGGRLYLHLRCKARRRLRYGTYQRRGGIRDRVSIHLRPDVVEQRRRLGDWEIDTVIGRRQTGALVSLTERRSRYVLIAKVPDRRAARVTAASLELLRPIQERVHTITADNGTEFAGHQELAEGLNAQVYFADPYAPWQRGSNENANGLLRQYFPKGSDFSSISQAELDHAMDRLNNRPRKCLAMQTPNQVLCGIKPSVALAS